MKNPPMPAVVTFTSVEQLPLVLTADLVMGLYVVKNYQKLLREIRVGRVPPPNAMKPLRWHKADVVRHLTQPRSVTGKSRLRSAG